MSSKANFLIGKAGIDYILSVLRESRPKDAIAQFQMEHGLSSAIASGSGQNALSFLDVLEVPRSEVSLDLLNVLVKTILDRIETLSQVQYVRRGICNVIFDFFRRLPDLLEKSYPYIGFEELRSIPMRIMCNIGTIPTTLLKSLKDHLQLLDIEVPAKILQQVLQYDSETLNQTILPCIRAYILEYLSCWSLESEMSESADFFGQKSHKSSWAETCVNPPLYDMKRSVRISDPSEETKGLIKSHLEVIKRLGYQQQNPIFSAIPNPQEGGQSGARDSVFEPGPPGTTKAYLNDPRPVVNLNDSVSMYNDYRRCLLLQLLADYIGSHRELYCSFLALYKKIHNELLQLIKKVDKSSVTASSLTFPMLSRLGLVEHGNSGGGGGGERLIWLDGGGDVNFLLNLFSALSSLRMDMVMLMHERNQLSICNADPIYQYSWCLSSSIRGREFNERRLSQMRLLFLPLEESLVKPLRDVKISSSKKSNIRLKKSKGTEEVCTRRRRKSEEWEGELEGELEADLSEDLGGRRLRRWKDMALSGRKDKVGSGSTMTKVESKAPMPSAIRLKKGNEVLVNVVAAKENEDGGKVGINEGGMNDEVEVLDEKMVAALEGLNDLAAVLRSGPCVLAIFREFLKCLKMHIDELFVEFVMQYEQYRKDLLQERKNSGLPPIPYSPYNTVYEREFEVNENSLCTRLKNDDVMNQILFWIQIIYGPRDQYYHGHHHHHRHGHYHSKRSPMIGFIMEISTGEWKSWYIQNVLAKLAIIMIQTHRLWCHKVEVIKNKAENAKMDEKPTILAGSGTTGNAAPPSIQDEEKSCQGIIFEPYALGSQLDHILSSFSKYPAGESGYLQFIDSHPNTTCSFILYWMLDRLSQADSYVVHQVSNWLKASDIWWPCKLNEEISNDNDEQIQDRFIRRIGNSEDTHRLAYYPEWIREMLFVLASTTFSDVASLRHLIIDNLLLPLSSKCCFIHCQIALYLNLARIKQTISLAYTFKLLRSLVNQPSSALWYHKYLIVYKVYNTLFNCLTSSCPPKHIVELEHLYNTLASADTNP